MSDYGRIRRGPMAADRFTQISNQLFRDTRLSFKAKGVFGLISTHRNGYGVTPEAIAAQSTDGVSAVKGALRELEAANYLKRTRVRRKDGTYGPSQYFITDMPELPNSEDSDQEEQQTPRSEPAVDFPPVDEPPVDEPPVVQPPVDEPPVEKTPHKKTSSKNTSLKNTPSPAARDEPAPPAAPAPGDEERGTPAPPTNNTPTDPATAVAEAWRHARGAYPNPMSEARIRTQAAELLAAGWTVENVTALAVDMARTQPTWTDLGRHADHWAPPAAPAPEGQAAPAAPDLPPWCGQCGDPMDGWSPAIDNPRLRTFETDDGMVLCPACHPSVLAAAAA